MPGNDREIFQLICDDKTSPTQIDMMAFALFFFEKEEWCAQFERQNNALPAQSDIDRFTADYTSARLNRLKVDAATFFDRSAREYLASEIEEEKQRVLESALLLQVKRSGSFWRQFGLAIITSILAPLVLALLLVTLSYLKDIPSPDDLASRLREPFRSVPTVPNKP